MSEREKQTRARVLKVVGELLESEGYDAVQVRRVASSARISLGTLYKLFSTRDELIVAALAQWMDGHVYQGCDLPPPDASLFEAQMWVFRRLFEPWQENSHVLEAYHRARVGPYGHLLDQQGLDAITPVMSRMAQLDPQYAEDFGLILLQMYYAAVTRFVEGTIPVTDILPILERAVFRLTSDNAALAEAFRHSAGT